MLIYILSTMVFLRLIFLFMLSSSLRAELGDTFNHLNCMTISRLSHFPGWLPGFLCLVEEEDGVEPLIRSIIST